MTKVWFVYIITNHTNSVLYVGVTNDLVRRMWEHKKGVVKLSFSERYRLYKLIWFQEFPSPVEAIEAEKKIKGWRRSKKIDIIRIANPTFRDLSAHYVR